MRSSLGQHCALQQLVVAGAAPEPLAMLAFGPFNAHARAGHRLADRRIRLLDDLCGGGMSNSGPDALAPLEAVGLHDLDEHPRRSRPGEDRFAFLRHARPLRVHLIGYRRLTASRHEPMQPLLHQKSGHPGALFGKAKMEVVDAVEMATAPLLIDARHFIIDSTSVRIGEFAARDTGDPCRIEALYVGRRKVAAEDTLLGPLLRPLHEFEPLRLSSSSSRTLRTAERCSIRSLNAA